MRKPNRIARVIAGGIAAAALGLGALSTPSAHAGQPSGAGQQTTQVDGNGGPKDTLRTKED